MIPIPDLIKHPLNLRNPTLKKYQRFFDHTNRYRVGDTITVIALYHLVDGIRRYNPINYYVRRCEERSISIKDVEVEIEQIKITEKRLSAPLTYDYLGVSIDHATVFENTVPRVSVYLDIFPAVYYEWCSGNKYFTSFDFALDYSLTQSSRFKTLFNHLKSELLQGNIGYEEKTNRRTKEI